MLGGGLIGLTERIDRPGGTVSAGAYPHRGFRCARAAPAGRGGRRVIRILLADDEHLIRGALAALLALEDDLDVVAQAATGAEALAWPGRCGPTSRCSTCRCPTSTASTRRHQPCAPNCRAAAR